MKRKFYGTKAKKVENLRSTLVSNRNKDFFAFCLVFFPNSGV
jgi:hypothetical protein